MIGNDAASIDARAERGCVRIELRIGRSCRYAILTPRQAADVGAMLARAIVKADEQMPTLLVREDSP